MEVECHSQCYGLTGTNLASPRAKLRLALSQTTKALICKDGSTFWTVIQYRVTCMWGLGPGLLSQVPCLGDALGMDGKKLLFVSLIKKNCPPTPTDIKYLSVDSTLSIHPLSSFNVRTIVSFSMCYRYPSRIRSKKFEQLLYFDSTISLITY